ncbi:family 43 glycosylhydrolase [Agromyces sp. MMS24-K17]|uniref:family 43 glycosylhydrolase n=1 Tax=Agromyces sp. MMS24-K17 TaxID=3372850 RepID=UPI003754C734
MFASGVGTTRLLTGAGVIAVLAAVLVPATTASAAVPTTGTPPVYDSYGAVSDPGASAAGYFQPYWYDTDGRHIQAHGGQIVAAPAGVTATSADLGVEADQVTAATEGGETVYYWYGEDRSNGYYDSPGVSVYRSTDTLNWTNEGVALRSVTDKSELRSDYFDDLYDTVADDGTPNQATIDRLFYYLNVKQVEADGTTPRLNAIFERPKALYNAQTGKWVMWWHADGAVTPGGSSYARSLAAVATSDSPTGPFELQGAYRLYNEPTYQSACSQSGAVPGGARDMTVFQDEDGTAYVVYSSEENRSLYIAKLNADYTNVEKTTTEDPTGVQFSADGRYPKIFADGAPGSPVNHEDYAIVKRCGLLEAPAMFTHDGTYYLLASGATGWAPNPQTYYTADSVLGGWIRGVEANDVNENVSYNQIPEGGDGLLSVGDTRKTTFGSQGTNVLTLDAAKGQYVYMGDRWNAGAADSTYVWLPLTFGENGRLEMRNPKAESAKWANGWDASYWDDKGAGAYEWTVADASLPARVPTNTDLADQLPDTVAVTANGATTDVAVTWSPTTFTAPGAQTITGRLAAGDGFTAGRTFTRTIQVDAYGLVNIAPQAIVTASSRQELAATTNDGRDAKGWDDWASSGTHPKSSWLTYTWAEPRTLDHVVVRTYRDGSTVTWPSKIAVQYQDATGAWKDSTVSASVPQNTSGAAPVVELDLTSLPATTALRLLLTTTVNTWQSITEVEAYGYGPNARTALSSLAVDGTGVAGFDAAKWNYSVAARNPADRVVTATAADPTSRVTVTQATSATPFAFVKVEALDGTKVVAVQTYRVGFVAPSTDATLASLTVDGTAVPGFAPATKRYDGLQFVPGTTPVVAATATNARASVSVGAYDPATKTVTVRVTAEDTAVKSDVVVGFVEDPRSWDAALSGLTVNGTAVAGFAPDTLDYTVGIGTWGTAPTVAGTARNAASAVEVASGVSTATVTVRAENPEKTRTYRLTFTAAACTNPAIAAPWRAAAWGTESNAQFCDGDGAAFRISDANDGAWTTKDNLSVISRPDVLPVGASIETYVPAVVKGNNSDPRAGLVVRNDLTRAGKASAKGYAIVVLSPTGGYLQYDANANGYIDTETAKVAAATWPAYVKLEVTSATSVTGYFRKAATDAWTKLGTAPISAAAAPLDAGVFAAGNNGAGASVATFLDTRFSFEVASVAATEVDTVAEHAPVLPATVTTMLVDGSTAERAVTWAAVEPAAYADLGTFTVSGVVEGTDLAAVATVTVVPPADTAVAPPAVGVLSSDNGWDTGLQDGDFRITMNLWWGSNATAFRLYQDGQLVATKWLADQTPLAQAASVDIAGLPNGTYRYVGVLTNSKGETSTKALTVVVKDANPGKPQLSHDNSDKDGAFVLTANLWWGTNATSYRFLENGAVIGEGQLVAATPGAQRAELAVTGAAKGDHVYTVEFANAAGVTTSAPITVKVAR